MKQIKVLIGPKGQVKIEAVGFTGESCLAATRKLEKALGHVEDRKDKDEMYGTEVEIDNDLYA